MWTPRSLADFRARAEGSFVSGHQWLYFAHESVFGYALWGVLRPADLAELVHVLEVELDRPPHAAVVDVSGVEAMGHGAFAVLARYVLGHAPALARVVTHTAMVRPRGLNGAIASGFFSAVAAPFPVTFWDDAAEAFARVGHPRPADAVAQLEQAKAASGGTPRLLRDLRQHLDGARAHALGDAARALGISVRTLQRRLGELGTSFAIESQEARVRAGERWLLESDAPITTIALEIGCATPQHFSELFQKRRGLTPSAFRLTRAGET